MKRPSLVLVTIICAGLLGGSAMAVAAQSPSTELAPPTSAMTTAFAPAFEYTIPGGISASERYEDPQLFALGPSGDAAPGQEWDAFVQAQGDASTTGARGIVLADVTRDAHVHACPYAEASSSRVPVRGEPEAFLADLRALGGLRLEDDGATVLGGRPAHAVVASPGTDCGGLVGDIHISGFRGNYVVLGIPSRIIVADVDGSTVMAQVWAGTPEDLEAWLPIAQEFLDSIHFVEPASP